MTLFTSLRDKKSLLRSFYIYLGVSGFVLLFGLVYEYFGHGIVSLSMICGFLYPLLLGALIYGILAFVNIQRIPSFLVQNFHNFGVACLTIASIFRGVLEIYGTTNDKFYYTFLIAGLVLLVTGISLYTVGLIKEKEDIVPE